MERNTLQAAFKESEAKALKLMEENEALRAQLSKGNEENTAAVGLSFILWVMELQLENCNYYTAVVFLGFCSSLGA